VRLEGSRVWGAMYEVAHFDDGYRGSSSRDTITVTRRFCTDAYNAPGP